MFFSFCGRQDQTGGCGGILPVFERRLPSCESCAGGGIPVPTGAGLVVVFTGVLGLIFV